MPRTARASRGGYCRHAVNRGNGRRTVFRKQGDFATFIKLPREAGERTDLRLLAYCLLPNHFQPALWPRRDGDLSAYLTWKPPTNKPAALCKSAEWLRHGVVFGGGRHARSNCRFSGQGASGGPNCSMR